MFDTCKKTEIWKHNKQSNVRPKELKNISEIHTICPWSWRCFDDTIDNKTRFENNKKQMNSPLSTINQHESLISKIPSITETKDEKNEIQKQNKQSTVRSKELKHLKIEPLFVEPPLYKKWQPNKIHEQQETNKLTPSNNQPIHESDLWYPTAINLISGKKKTNNKSNNQTLDRPKQLRHLWNPTDMSVKLTMFW